MKIRKYFGKYGKCVISNIPHSNLDHMWAGDYFEAPSIRMYYVTFGGDKKVIDESFYGYCSWYVSRNDERDVEQYKFLGDNLIAILRGELEDWRLAHIEICSWSTNLYIANLKFDSILSVSIDPGQKKLKLLFEIENSSGSIVRYFYNLRREIPLGRHLYLGRETQFTTVYADGSFRKFKFSGLKDSLYEWLTGQDCCPVDIIEQS